MRLLPYVGLQQHQASRLPALRMRDVTEPGRTEVTGYYITSRWIQIAAVLRVFSIHRTVRNGHEVLCIPA